MTHLSLFTGIGGLDLAAEWAGFETVGQCERADYPTKVLEKHWPDVPRWRDIRSLTKEDFYERTGLQAVDVISGGFPCQPFSVAGKRRGKEDDRYLWPEMLRVIQELRPTWVVGENVAGIVSLALDQVLSDLESIGYACQAFIIPACAVDAPHRRDRCAIVGYADRRSVRNDELHIGQTAGKVNALDDAGAPCRNSAFTHAKGSRRKRYDQTATKQTCGPAQGQPGAARRPGSQSGGWWPAEPDVGRVAHGIPSRVDRLRCLGNAVVPAQFYPVFKAIAEVMQKGDNSEKQN